MLLPSGRRLNEMDTFFFAHSRVKDGVYRFAGCFECAADGVTPQDTRAAVEGVIGQYPEVFLFDTTKARSFDVDVIAFDCERKLRDFYAQKLSEPVEFGNVLLRVWLIDKPDRSRALFLLIPHFAGDSKIASFVLDRVLGKSPRKEREPLQFVSYKQLARNKMKGSKQLLRSYAAETKEMLQSFSLTSPAKGKMDIATVFLSPEEFKMVNGARRAVGLSRTMLLQVAAIHAYRALLPRKLARVFNIIYDNTPAASTLNNCFRSMPFIAPKVRGELALEQTRDLFNAFLRRYEKPENRYAFLFRSALAGLLPLWLIRKIFARTTRAVQHYISYVFLNEKIAFRPGGPGGHRIWGNIEPVGYALSNFNVMEHDKQISLNITWDTASLGSSFGGDLLESIRQMFHTLEEERRARETGLKNERNAAP